VYVKLRCFLSSFGSRNRENNIFFLCVWRYVLAWLSNIWIVSWYNKNRKHFESYVRVKYLHYFSRKWMKSFAISVYFITSHCNFLGISRSIPASSLNFYRNCSSLSSCFFTWLPWCLLNGFCTTLRLTVNIKFILLLE